jgi:hypothetical protein
VGGCRSGAEGLAAGRLSADMFLRTVVAIGYFITSVRWTKVMPALSGRRAASGQADPGLAASAHARGDSGAAAASCDDQPSYPQLFLIGRFYIAMPEITIDRSL